MGVADTAKGLGMTVEQFFHTCYKHCGHLYPNELPPDKAITQYKYWGKVPLYVVSYTGTLRLRVLFARIRERYKQPP